jgi:tetratricopeptide (TPR) repeat protein
VLRGVIDAVSSARSDREGKFLRDAPREIREILDWYATGHPSGSSSSKMREFANAFLGALAEDQAIVPVVETDPPKLLAMVLLHHEENPGNATAWLNLGLALRRMALYRARDSGAVNKGRLQYALESFQRALELEPENRPKNIRAWIGRAFTYHQLGRFEDELNCCHEAVELDRSDPALWLLYSFALKSAGKKREALAVVEDAYKAYLMAGQPEGLRHLFADVMPQGAIPDPHPEPRKIV